MNDIKNITDKIISDAQLSADANQKLAQSQAEEILSSYREKAENIRTASAAKARREADEALSRARASHKMQERNALLAAKCEVLDEAFARAAHQLTSLSADEYTDLLISLFEKAVLPQDTVICMNERDLKNTSLTFFSKAKDIFSEKHPKYKLELSDTPVNISGGFILKNGGIELNCSLESCLVACREKHENDIFKLLFN